MKCSSILLGEKEFFQFAARIAGFHEGLTYQERIDVVLSHQLDVFDGMDTAFGDHCTIVKHVG